MDVAIIAAGEGLRLKEEGINIPKPLIEINGIPLIQRIVSSVYKNGAESITCIINEESKELERYLLTEYNNQPFRLIVKSTESSFHSLKEISNYVSSSFLLTTTDSVFSEEEFESFLNFSQNHEKADAVLAVTDFIDDEKPLYSVQDSNNKITKLSDEEVDCRYVTGGLYYFRKDIREYVQAASGKNISRLRNFLRYLLQQEFNIYAFPFSKIIDVDHVADIKEAESFIANNKN